MEGGTEGRKRLCYYILPHPLKVNVKIQEKASETRVEEMLPWKGCVCVCVCVDIELVY